MSNTGGVAADQLRAFVERIERLEEEKKCLSDDIKDVYAEARATVSTPRQCVQWFACASRTPMSGKKWKPFLTSICMPSEWPRANNARRRSKQSAPVHRR